MAREQLTESIERALVGEKPVVTEAARIEFALLMHDLKTSLANMPNLNTEYIHEDEEGIF